MSSPIEGIIAEVRDPDFAKEYGQELAKINVAVTMAKARTEKGLTQEQLAVRAGTSQPYIAKLESGYANPSIGAVAKILAVLGFRLVPGKDSLIPEKKPPYHVNYLATSEVAPMPTETTPGFIPTANLTPNYDRVLRQNPNSPWNGASLSFALRAVGGAEQFTGESCRGVTANNENLVLAGN